MQKDGDKEKVPWRIRKVRVPARKGAHEGDQEWSIGPPNGESLLGGA